MHDPLAVVAIPTQGDADKLKRAVGSCITEAARWGRRLEIVVFDDSDGREEPANEAVLVEAARSGNVVRYASAESRSRFAAALTDAVGHAAAIQLGLSASGFRQRYGAVRNGMALELSGRAFLSLDDDMSLRAFDAPDASTDCMKGHGDPTETWFFTDERSACAFAEKNEVDLLGAHGKLLGCAAGGLPVIATWTGFYGDSGTPSPALYLCPEGASVERLARSASFLDLARSRQIVRAVTRPTFATTGFWTTGAAAYGAEPCPPFFPVLRGEGLVFGALTAVLGKAALGYVPAVVAHHASGRGEHGGVDFARAASEHALAPVVASLLHAAAGRLKSAGAEVDLPALGRELRQLADRPAAELSRLVIERQRARRAAILGRIRALVAARAEPSPWKSAAESFLRAADSIADRALAVPTDLCAEVGQENAAEALRDLLERFGALLAVWSQLHAGARVLREAGVTASHLIPGS